MQLEGIGGSTARSISTNSGMTGQMAIDGSRPNIGEQEITNQTKRVESKNHVEEKYFFEKRVYSEDDVQDIIEKANKEFIAHDRKFEFSIHEKTKQVMIKVLDSVTNDVIKELPPERLLDIIAGIWEVAGIMVDKKI